jgi:hypothetical protein
MLKASSSPNLFNRKPQACVYDWHGANTLYFLAHACGLRLN